MLVQGINLCTFLNTILVSKMFSKVVKLYNAES